MEGALLEKEDRRIGIYIELCDQLGEAALRHFPLLYLWLKGYRYPIGRRAGCGFVLDALSGSNY